jgi:hypothetical protein
MTTISRSALAGSIGLATGGRRHYHEAAAALQGLQEGGWSAEETAFLLEHAEQLVRFGTKFSSSKGAELRVRALQVVAVLKGHAAVTSIIGALGSGDPPLQAEAESALERLLKQHPAETSVLEECLARIHTIERDTLRRMLLRMAVRNPTRQGLTNLLQSRRRRKPGEVRWELDRAADRIEKALRARCSNDVLLRPAWEDGSSMLRPACSNPAEEEHLVRAARTPDKAAE